MYVGWGGGGEEDTETRNRLRVEGRVDCRLFLRVQYYYARCDSRDDLAHGVKPPAGSGDPQSSARKFRRCSAPLFRGVVTPVARVCRQPEFWQVVIRHAVT